MGHLNGYAFHLRRWLALQHCVVLLHGMSVTDVTLPWNLYLLVVQGDPAEILASPLYQPVGQLFYNSLGRGGGIFYTVCAFIILQFVCFTATVSPTQLSLCQSNFFELWAKVKFDRLRSAPCNHKISYRLFSLHINSIFCF